MKRKTDKLLLIGGVVNTLFGLSVYSDSTFCYYFDTYCTEMEPFHKQAGIGICLIGLFMLIMTFRKGQRDYKEMFICPKCQTAHPLAEVPDETCPECQTKMEPLKGYYKRHPELKDE